MSLRQSYPQLLLGLLSVSEETAEDSWNRGNEDVDRATAAQPVDEGMVTSPSSRTGGLTRPRRKKCDSNKSPCGNCTRLGLECWRDTNIVWEDDVRRVGMRRRGPRPTSINQSSNSESASPAIDAEKIRGDDMAHQSRHQPSRGNEHLEAESVHPQASDQATSIHLTTSWPFELDATESLLLDHYVQRFSRTYPTFSGPSNPFLSIILPLAARSRTVLDSMLALSGVQSWGNGGFAMKHAMLKLRQNALTGCRTLLARLGGPPEVHSRPLPASGSNVAADETPGEAKSFDNEEILHLLASCALLLLYEKLAGEGEDNWNPHLRFFARLLSERFVPVMIDAVVGNHQGPSTESFQFLASLFLYNDLVRSTSLRLPTLSSFYLDAVSTSITEPQPRNLQLNLSQDYGRFTFPRIIARISAGDMTVGDAEIMAWDGRLDWFPSFALVPPQEQPANQQAPFDEETLITDPSFHRLDSFSHPDQWDEPTLISELYRIAALIYRRLCALQSPLEKTDHGLSVPSPAYTRTGNLPLWATQLIQRLPQDSPYQNTLLWPIGIVAKELTGEAQDERKILVSKLQSLEEIFQMRHFGRVRDYLLRYWSRTDRDSTRETQAILFG